MISVLTKYKIDRWWSAKAGRIFVCIFLGLLVSGASFENLGTFFLSAIAVTLGFGLFGYLLNDLTDRREDLILGKSNMFSGKGSAFRVFKLLVLIVILELPWIWLATDHISWLLILGEISLFIFYSVPPIRLKRNAIGSALLDALYAYTIPAVLATYTLELELNTQFPIGFYLAIIAWNFASGIAHILIHQTTTDSKDQNTLPMVIGMGLSIKISKLFLLFDRLLPFGLAIALFSENVLGGIPFLALSLYLLISFIYKARRFRSNSIPGVSLFLHEDQEFLYGLALIIGIMGSHWSIELGPIIFFVLFFPSWLIRDLRGEIVRGLLSRPVNWWIYKSRINLGQSPKEARKQFYDPGLHDKSLYPKKNSQITVLVANQSDKKLSETFIEKHLRDLNYRTLYLYGGKIPYKLRGKGSILDGLPDMIRTKEEKLKKVSELFLKEDVRMILAEFGPTAVELLPVCKTLGIPLIVVHHGYDIHQTSTWNSYLDRYLELWEYAFSIIGVSEEICKKIVENSDFGDKVMHLPCAVELSLFPFFEGQRPENKLLFVGRLVENKGPHLALLCLYKLQEEHPDLMLTFLGSEDHSNMSESLKQLVIALDLERKVIFKSAVDHSEVYKEMCSSTVLLAPSVTNPISGDKEGTPVVIQEAMAAGLPIVAFDHAGIGELIEHGVSGLLSREYDMENLQRNVSNLLLDENLRTSLAHNAFHRLRSLEVIEMNAKILNKTIEKHLLKN